PRPDGTISSVIRPAGPRARTASVIIRRQKILSSIRKWSARDHPPQPVSRAGGSGCPAEPRVRSAVAGPGRRPRARARVPARPARAAALAGRGSLVLIGGEAGIGKSTLAEALADEAASQGALVLVGGAHDLAETPPYGPWAELLAGAPAESGQPSSPELAGAA